MLSDVVNAGEAYSALCALLWAVAVVLFRKSGEHVAPVALNLFKDTVGLALFLVTLPIIGVPYLPAEHGSHDWLVLLASGAVGIGIADSLFFASLNRLGAGRSAIVDCLYSPLVILCSFIYLGEPVGYPLLIAVGLMVAAILVGAWQPETSAAAEDKRDVRLGIALGVGSMLFMAIGIVIAKPVLNHTNPWWSTSVRLVGGVALLGVQVGLSSKRRDLLRCFRPGRLWRVTLPSAVVDVKQLAAFADPIQAGSEPSANSLDNVLRVMRASERAPELRPAIQDALEPYGAAVELLLNGSVVAVISGGAAPTDLAVRTARAALALRSCLDDASVGVASGRAIKGERKAIGPLIDTAAALVLSRSRAIRIDATTRELLPERFDVHEDQAGWFELRAEREPETEAREPSRLLLGKPTPCVGRKRIIGQLAPAFDGCVEDSEAHAVLVIGAAGVGKSRVRAELVERLRGESAPPSVISGFGDPLRAQTPYALLGRALFRYLGIRDSDEGARLEAVRARAGRHLSVEDAAVVPAFLGALMGVNFPDEDLPALRAARADPVFMADRVAWAWTTWLEAECAANPVLLIIDDLQWADAPTVEFIAETLRSTREQPLMVLALARPAVEDRFPTLRDSWRHQRIDLAPLRPAACAQLAREFLGDGASEELIDQVVRRSEGNAFYLEELIRTAASGGADAPSDTVIASIQLRVSRLPGQARQILRAASVFGQAFWAGGVAALLEGRVSRSEVEDWLAELTQQELIARAGNTSGFAGETGHSFRHDLLREAVYGMLPEADRVAGHRLAGKWLREQGERDPAVLAEHFAGGGAAEQAVAWFEKAAEKALAELGHEGEVAALRRAATYCRRAGETAAKAYANENAILFFERAAALFDLLDPVEAARTRIELSKVREHVGQREEAIRDVERGRETIAGVEGVQQVEVDLLIRLGTLEMRSHKEGALERAERIARESRELASSVGARQREAAALTLLANVLCRYESDESSKKAVAYAERALTLCKEPGAIAESLFTLGNALVMCNQHARADSVYRKAFAAAEAINSEGLMASCLGNRGVASFRRWELGAAIDQCERSLGLFRLIGHRRRIVEGTHNLGAYRLVVGETADAKRLVEAALADAGGDWVIASYCNETLATIARNEGDEQRAQELLREGVVLCERAGVAERQALFLGLLAESLWTTGEVQEAIDSLERAVATGAGVSLSHALLMARMGELQDALAWFQQFMEEDPDPHRRMIATMAAVRASWALGRLGEARAACRAAIEILRPANARPLLTQAETLMACLEGVAARAVDCYLQARIHCGRGVIAEVALDVATCLHDATDDLDADMIRRFLDESADIEDCGLRYRLEDLRAGLFERLGEAELARVALGNARSGVQALLEQMPVEHRAMFEAHPWVRAIMRVRLTP